MGSAVLALITSRLVGPIGFGLSILLGLALGISHVQLKARDHTIRNQLAQIAHLSQDLQQAVANERALTSAINRQNAAVAALRRDEEERARRVQQAVHSAARGRSVAERTAGTIMAAKPTGDVCKAAVDLIKGRA